MARFTVYPSSHYVTPRDTTLRAIEAIKGELRERIEFFQKAGRLVEAQRIEQRTRFDLEMLAELGFCKGIENYSRHRRAGRRRAADPYRLPAAGRAHDHRREPRHDPAARRHVPRRPLAQGEPGRVRLPPASALDNRPLRFDEFEKVVRQTIFVSATPGGLRARKVGRRDRRAGGPADRADRPRGDRAPASTQVDDLLSEIRERVKRSERVLVTTLTKRMAEELTEYLAEHGVKVRYLHSEVETVERVEIIRDLRLGEFDVLVGINLLREGLDLPEVSLVAILDADKEGFLRSSARSSRPSAAPRATSTAPRSCTRTRRPNPSGRHWRKPSGAGKQRATTSATASRRRA